MVAELYFLYITSKLLFFPIRQTCIMEMMTLKLIFPHFFFLQKHLGNYLSYWADSVCTILLQRSKAQNVYLWLSFDLMEKKPYATFGIYFENIFVHNIISLTVIKNLRH